MTGTDESGQPSNEQSRSWFYTFIAESTHLMFRILYRCFVRGLENVPASGGLLVVCNHQSHLDPPLVGSTISRRRQVHFVARAGLFKNPLFSRLISALNSFPIEEGGRSDIKAIRTILEHLNAGEAVLLFPEGSRSPDATLQEFKRGIELLLRRAHVPVVPVAVDGCFDAFPRGASFPRLFGEQFGVRYGKPISPEEIAEAGSEATLARLADEIDAMRLSIRAEIRQRTKGKRPRPGPADHPRVSRDRAQD